MVSSLFLRKGGYFSGLDEKGRTRRATKRSEPRIDRPIGRTASERPGRAAASAAVAAGAWLLVVCVGGLGVGDCDEGWLVEEAVESVEGEGPDGVEIVAREEEKRTVDELDWVGVVVRGSSVDESEGVEDGARVAVVEEADTVKVLEREEELREVVAELVGRRLVARRVRTVLEEGGVGSFRESAAVPIASAGGVSETTGVEAKNGRRLAEFVESWRARCRWRLLEG